MAQDKIIKTCKKHGVNYVVVEREDGKAIKCMRCHLSNN